MFKKKFLSVALTSIFSLAVASSAFAANDGIVAIAAPNQITAAYGLVGQGITGKFTVATTSSTGYAYATVTGCGERYTSSDVSGTNGQYTTSIFLKSGCSYQINLYNYSGGTAKAYLNNWYN
ncbi:hypothetical protein P4H65_10520 [Paenibacillus chitinolyticus]|uniref:hypothetical protein n=1 Tax=Paenibacillus chitinolyticus TaxID=79263 RepID=UPI002DB588CF|nr:hypothetical protein [Paenibacillus chitinolyticus]MEC0246219.1 hypothetical protein [Paenibacillus chitinolyticus]